jgi:PTS system nitrogen regulatory IIA component
MANNENKKLADLIESGGIYYTIPGNSLQEVLSALIGSIKSLPAVSRQELLRACLEREALMSTSVGSGIALPHPRNPLAAKSEDQFTALGFLEHPVNWNALDGKPVDTLFFIVSSSAKLHLHTLSKINFFCQDEAFLKLLQNRASQNDIIKFIKDTEQDWE